MTLNYLEMDYITELREDIESLDVACEQFE